MMQEEKKTPEIRKTRPPVAGLKPIQSKASQKKKKKMSASALVCIVLIIAVIAIFAAVYFDLGGAKQTAASLLGIQTADPAGDEAAAKKETELKNWEQRLSQKEADIDLKEDKLAEKEDELTDKEAELKKREAELAEAEKDADEAREAYLKSVAQIFEKMEVKKAANAISGMETVQDMAKILLYMTSEKAAIVMNQMKSALATEILSEMMK